MHIVNDVCNGIIQTAWDTHVVGTRSGVLFRAQIESETGEYRINFLLNVDDLKRGADILREMHERVGTPWGEAPSRFPCEELYRFYDLSSPSRCLN